MKHDVVKILKDKTITNAPKWLPDNLLYAVIMGSQAYGTNVDSSDIDVYGFVMPPKELTFPHLAGEIPGFGTQLPRFEQYQEHHRFDKSRQVEYDFSIYSIVKYMQLIMDNNPNMIDSIFVPDNCILHNTTIGQNIRDKRKQFLHKGSWAKFRGYATSQWHKMNTKEHATNPKRQDDIQAVGYSTKYAMHLVRLLLGVEQILSTEDYVINRDRNMLKSIRNREWTLEKLTEWKETKLIQLEDVYSNSKLREVPDEKFMKNLLLESLEHHYGSISELVKVDIEPSFILDQMQYTIDNLRSKL